MRDAFAPRPEHRRIVFLTGAGLSARAGLPTFRGEDGLWSLEPELERAMHADALPGSIPDLWRVWPRLAARAEANGPTPGHLAIARMGAEVITQNIDGLHQVAGSRAVHELHGSAARAACLGPGCTWSAPLRPGDGERAEDHGVPAACPACGAPTRPDVVLFDEALPAEELATAQELARTADLFVAVGTSNVVFPAAELAPLARRSGAETVLIDIAPEDPLAARAQFDHVIAADAHEVLPAWERVRNGGRSSSFLDPFG
ncbi:SIR2 family NAD-dependent protein deacylase [Brachybacterium huguangmaarense]